MTSSGSTVPVALMTATSESRLTGTARNPSAPPLERLRYQPPATASSASTITKPKNFFTCRVYGLTSCEALMADSGKVMIVIGGVIVAIGLVLWGLGRL